jgi:hypothetical protein
MMIMKKLKSFILLLKFHMHTPTVSMISIRVLQLGHVMTMTKSVNPINPRPMSLPLFLVQRPLDPNIDTYP